MMTSFKVFILLSAICLWNCSKQKSPSYSAKPLSETELNTIYEKFEETTFEKSEQYLANPDSLLALLPKQTRTNYQNTLYCYGLAAMGYNLLQDGNILESIKAYEKAYDISKTEKIVIPEEETPIIKPLANLYIRINDNDKAINLLENYIVNIPASSEIAGWANNLANAYFYKGNLEKAVKIAIEASSKNKNPLNQALLYNTLSSIYEKMDNKTLSLKYNKLALALFDHEQLYNDTLLWYISALGLNGELTNDLQKSKNALHILEQHFPNSQLRVKAKILQNIAHSYDNKQQYSESLQTFSQIIQTLHRSPNKYTLDYTFTNALLGKANAFSALHQIDSAWKYYEWAIENDFRTQQLIVTDGSQLSGNLWNRQQIDNLLKLISKSQTISNDMAESLLWCIELSKARLLINEMNRSEQWEQLPSDTQRAIAKIRSLYQEQDNSTAAQKNKIQQQIDQLILAFQLSEKHFEASRFAPNKANFLQKLKHEKTSYYAYLVHLDGSWSILFNTHGQWQYQHTKDSKLTSKIDIFKQMYFADRPDHFNQNPKAYQQQATEFIHKLLPNIQSAQQKIFLSLDGALYGLPFDALYDSDYLIQKHNFAYINSFLLFDLLKVDETAKHPISVFYRAEYNAPLPNLPYVNQEVEKMAQLAKTTLLPPNQQNDSSIIRHFGQSSIIHIAAHTILDSAEAPIIYLKKPISTNQLRYFNIQAPLVFLSACNTGKGKPLPVEGTESIQRVFLSKNVPSVISTYWFANDESMLKLTQNFYEELAKSPDPIFALAEAKRKYIAAASISHSNPWYWANINYTGVGNEIGLKKTSNLFLLVTICSIVLLIIGFVYLFRSRFYASSINKNEKS